MWWHGKGFHDHNWVVNVSNIGIRIQSQPNQKAIFGVNLTKRLAFKMQLGPQSVSKMEQPLENTTELRSLNEEGGQEPLDHEA